MYKQFAVILGGVALLSLVGCAGKSAVKPPANVAAGGSDAQGSGAEAAGMAGAGGGTAADTAASGAAPSGVARLIYFDFDSSEIRPEFVTVIAAHARALAGHGSIHVRLEGHTDERGSPEYNIGLGERRAQAVRRALLLQGVADAQVTTVSYGEERPALTGQGEAVWAKNRRVEIVYIN